MPPIYVFYAYGALAISHIVLQMILGHLEYRRQQRMPSTPQPHSVTVVVPVYNEDPQVLDQCVRSIYEQNHHDLEILVVDDGSTNWDQLNTHVYKHYNHGRLRVIRLPENIGKRQAQKVAFDAAKGEVVVTVDSDTIVHKKDSISRIVERFDDNRVGAVTGHVKVENKSHNFLTRLISARYWTAFNQERAAQSLFGVVMCCSGPFSAYRREVLRLVEDAYVTQRFLGKPCTFGDDRHLTNLVLDLGYRVAYDGRAEASTYVPNYMKRYLGQQLRWNKSFYREMLWTLRAIPTHSFYLTYEVLIQFIMPFFLVAVLILTGIQAAEGHLNVLAIYAITLFGIAFLRCLYALWRLRDPWILVFIVYGVLHVFLLIPTRFFALATLRKTQWGTR